MKKYRIATIQNGETVQEKTGFRLYDLIRDIDLNPEELDSLTNLKIGEVVTLDEGMDRTFVIYRIK